MDGAVSYPVYRSTGADGPYVRLNTSQNTNNYYSDRNLAPGTYYYKVSGFYSNGPGKTEESGQSGYVYQTIGGGPSTPTGMRGTALGSSVTVFWDPVSGAASYRVYRSLLADSPSDDSSYTLVGSASETSLTLSHLNGGVWRFKVSALSENGDESQLSSSFSVTDSIGLTTPRDLRARVSGNSVTVTWNITAPANIEYYWIFRTTEGVSGYSKIAEVASPSTSYTDSDLEPGAYHYAVSSYSASLGEGALSSSSPAATVSDTLEAPANITTEAPRNNVSLSWNSVPGAASYKVYRSNSVSGEYDYIGQPSSSFPTSYFDSTLEPGTYYYKVSSVSSTDVEGPLSGSVSARILKPPYSPADLSATVTGNSITLSWTPEAGAAYYQVLRNDNYSSFPNNFQWVADNVTSASYTDSGLSAGAHYYKVLTVSGGYVSSQELAVAVPVTVGGN